MDAPKDSKLLLDQIRGSIRQASANARTVAALTDNPGCQRRRVIDAAGLRAHELAKGVGFPARRGQSPFAITTGIRFEHRLKKGSNYKLLTDVLRAFVDLPSNDLRVRDLKIAPGKKLGVESLRARADQTDEVLKSIASGDNSAPHLVDHPVLIFDMAGQEVFLEPDALAFRVGSRLELVEIKSYPVIDGQADPEKVAATAGQAAVYVLALRATLKRLGFDPELLQSSVVLVAPKNFGRNPVAHRIPLRKRVMSLQRVLSAVPSTSSILADVPSSFTLDIDPEGRLAEPDRRKSLDSALRKLPMLYVPECLASCDLSRYCRNCAVVDDDPSRIGRAARDGLAGIATLKDAIRLSRQEPNEIDEQLIDVAASLRAAYESLKRARAATITPQPSSPVSGRTGSKRR